MKIKRVAVKKNERGLLLRNGDFERVLQPGTHWLFDDIDHLRVETFALEQPAFTHGLADTSPAHIRVAHLDTRTRERLRQIDCSAGCSPTQLRRHVSAKRGGNRARVQGHRVASRFVDALGAL